MLTHISIETDRDLPYPRVSSEFIAGYNDTVQKVSLRSLLGLHIKQRKGGGNDFDSPFISCGLVENIDVCNQLALILKSKVKAFEMAVKIGRYSRAVSLIENKYRLPLLISYAEAGLISPSGAWKLAREIWIESNETTRHKSMWQEFFSIDLGSSTDFMTEPDLKRLYQLPDTIKIFRGYLEPSCSRGISWTMSRVIASQFSGCIESAQISQGYVHRDNVVGFVSLLGQFEIVVNHQDSVKNQRAVPTIKHAALAKRAKNGSQS